jgi:nicotinate-nucleotide adenylyltransferase
VKLGLFGGSFDPIHAGHIRPVAEARRLLGLDRIVYLPTARPPHKPGRALAPAHQRYAMVELALLHEEGLEVSTLELDSERPVYTVETVSAFRRQLPLAELHLVIGADSFLDLHHWVRWQEIIELARLVVLVRPGWETGGDRTLPPGAAEALRRGRVDFAPNLPVAVSATELRTRFAQGSSVSPELVPPLVLDFIAKYRLYR